MTKRFAPKRVLEFFCCSFGDFASNEESDEIHHIPEKNRWLNQNSGGILFSASFPEQETEV